MLFPRAIETPTRQFVSRVTAAVVTALLALASAVQAGDQNSSSDPKHSALVLYDGAVTNGEGRLLAMHTANLMGHFGFKADVRPMGAYTTGLAEPFGALFVCGMADGTSVPAALLEEVVRRTGPTVWFHLHLDQLTAQTNAAAKLGFTYVENDDEAALTTAIYRAVRLPKTDYPEIDRVNILDPAKVQVVATAEDEDQSEKVPYVLRSGQFWYFAAPGYTFETESDASLILADLLHEILGVKHQEERRALARIEDVSADSDPDELRRVADVLASRHIPFQIALIPLYKNPINHQDLSLSEAPDVVAAVRYMVAHGGTVVMHGVTHQFHGITGDDYEFWDTVANRPTPDGALNVLGPKLQTGLDECFRVGLFPLAFETPHYGASLEHYRSLATVFSHCYERRILCEQDDTVEFCPFLTTDTQGEIIIPENLGYVPEEKPDVLPIIEAAHRLRVVRDPVASFYFHPFMPAKYLEQIVDAVKRDGYRFVSIKEFAPNATLSDYAVTAQTRTLTLAPRQPFLKTTSVDAQGQATEQFQPVEPGKPLTLTLQPPAGGLAAVQSVAQAPVVRQQPKPGWKERLRARLLGPNPQDLLTSSRHARQALILGSSPSFESALSVYGIPCHPLNLTNPIPDDAFVVLPRHARLDEAGQKRLATWLEQGGRAVIEGHTPFAERLGFQFEGRTFAPGQIQDFLLPDVPIKWSGAIQAERFRPPSLSATLIAQAGGGLPVAVASRIGDGLVIYLAAELDPETGLGYTRYPFLVHHLRQRFGLSSPVSADGVEFYFDPGFRERTSIEELVKAWRDERVRAIYAAAWHSYPHWTYDYDRLIRLCHAEGIAVYAWLEFPAVCPKMWEDHPEWREKTVTGRDAEIGWRKFMNFANPECRAAALQFMDDLLDHHDWDGVNIAELCFDTDDGLAKPEGYIPMNANVRQRFQQQAGYDPSLLFDPQSPKYWQTNATALAQWTAFRNGLTRDWLAEMLQRLSRRSLDVIVTALDSFSVPRVIEKNGCDSRDVVALMDRYNFTLQVEDSEEMWGESPTRYAGFGEVYRKLVPDRSRLMFDINVVNERQPGKASTAAPAGLEIALSAGAAANAGNGRVGIYSEATVPLEDRGLLPFVMGAGTTVSTRPNATVLVASRPVRFQYDVPRQSSSGWAFWRRSAANKPQPLPIMDGQAWFFGAKGTTLLPAGQHQFTGLEAAPQKQNVLVKDFTALFSSLTSTKAGFALDYTSPRRAWMRLSRSPSAVLSDGRELSGSVARSGRDWLVALPAGHHRVEIQTGTTVEVAVEEAGEHALSSIVWLGTRGVLFLSSLYGLTRVRRFWLLLKGRAPNSTSPSVA